MIAVLVILFILAISQVISTLALMALIKHRAEEKADHAKCIALVAEFTGNQFAAHVLEAAAEDYDSMDGQANLMRVRDGGQWQDGGPSIPSLWILDRAKTMREMDW